ncbi:MAG: OsmC family protein [Thaumarchaeota archaeon]|nr:OsmC family protein [Nitrososphaerota archaeon]
MNGEAERLNNLNLARLRSFVKEVSRDPSKGVEKTQLTLHWVFEEVRPQMYAEISAERYSIILEAELPSFLGGRGIRPSPAQYFLYAVAACFLSYLMAIASQRGIRFEKAIVKVDAEMNHSMLGGSGVESPVKIGLGVKLEPELPEQEALALLEDAKLRCPVFQPINLEINLLR